MKIMKTNQILKIMNMTFIDMPSPSMISFNWNYGSLLGIMLIIQILSGVLMSFHYSPDITMAFSSINLSARNIPFLWIIHYLHANGASLMFMLIYLHIGRNLYFSSYKNSKTWSTGVMMLLILMTIAFMGYVLPWGQMSYWGVTVITNLLSSLPYIGSNIVTWLWGGFSVNNPTLKRFYSLHFLLPMMMLILTIIHLMFLHQHGSTNPLMIQNQNDTIHFHPFFSIKDLMSLMLMLSMLFLMILINPLTFNDPENFNMANPMNTPTHIQPEWYFLFAYTILRSIPSKIGGVIALIMSILILMMLPLLTHMNMPLKFNPFKKIIFWLLINTFLILTWIGMNPPSYPLIMIGYIFSFLYFLLIILLN